MARPGISDLTGDHELARLARETWLSSSATKVLPQSISKLWKLLEDDHFSHFSLLLLEQLQALERYLWPGYTEDSSNQHVLLLALLVNTKRREQLPIWPLFASTPDEFSHFFRRIIHLSIDTSLSTTLRTDLLTFIVEAFQSLDHGIVRKECAALVSIGIWHNLHSDLVREKPLNKSTQLQRAWRAAGKKVDVADSNGQARLRFEEGWLHILVLNFFDKIYDDNTSAGQKQSDMVYCERTLELLCDLQSQLPTRRYVNTLLKDMNILPAIALSPMYHEQQGLREMYALLVRYTEFPIDDQDGRQLSRQEYEEAQNRYISRLQKASLKLQPEKLKMLYLSNFGTLSQRLELQNHLTDLTDPELLELCQEMHLRTREYPEKSLLVRDRAFFIEALVTLVQKKTYYTEQLRPLNVLPTEKTLYDPAMLRIDEFDHSRPLPIPKLNLQYLTVGDFLWRSFMLNRYGAYYDLRKHLEDVSKRLQPRRNGGITRFDGFSRMAIPISKPAIIETQPPRVGQTVSAEVKAEIILDVSRLQPGLRREWETLRSDDTVYLLALHPEDAAMRLTNGKVNIRQLKNLA